ncbi:MAG: alkyl hydroperoxide reductase [Acidobacteria bacterium]|nr:MAG: alkyl hydroperoxide reductase [Acidobacteriota bacterium]PYT87436.1 MAG: alkyl hydroperoxide reductase [Acidobacteriota bacterium]
MLRHIVALITLLATSLALTTSAPADLTPAASRKPLPEVALSDSNGASVDLSAYKGRVVLLDFWATWCEGCKEEIPWFMEFQNKYKKTGLTVVGASLDDGWKSVTPYLREHKINYRIVMGTFESAKQFGVDKGMPITLLIDRHGKIADVHPGMVDKAAFEREIQTLLNENTTKTPN